MSTAAISRPRREAAAPTVNATVYGDEVLKRRVKIWWQGDGCWFSGIVKQVNAVGEHFVKYDDGDVKWHNLGHEDAHKQLQWLDAEQPTKKCSEPKSLPKRKRADAEAPTAQSPEREALKKARKAKAPTMPSVATSTTAAVHHASDANDDDSVLDAIGLARACGDAHLLLGNVADWSHGRTAPSSDLSKLLDEANQHMIEASANAPATAEGHAGWRHTLTRIGALGSTLRRLHRQPPVAAIGRVWHWATDPQCPPEHQVEALAALRAAIGPHMAASGHAAPSVAAVVPPLSLLVAAAANGEHNAAVGAAAVLQAINLKGATAAMARETTWTVASSSELPSPDALAGVVGALVSPIAAARVAAARVLDALVGGYAISPHLPLLWPSIAFHGYPTAFNGPTWLSATFRDLPRPSAAFHGLPRPSMAFHGLP